ncbi:MAG: hypothetical protein M0D54_04870 [Hyphomonadaceae bacterium JAD_PAG50586_4]|nr:MAG: hypothetical protein M0D54_04870 [Hyphomonadaceae bacterium JAD_PAG50586_4]
MDAWIANPSRAAAYDFSETISETQPWPLLARSMIAVAIIGANGARLWCDAHFNEWAPDDAIDLAIVAATRSSGVARSSAASDANGQPLVLIYLPGIDGAAFLEARRIEAGQIVVVALSLAHDADILLAAARAHGMTEREARIAAALVRHGTLPAQPAPAL